MAVTCTQTALVICSVMEERCQLLNDPPSNILLEKNEVSEQKKKKKNGNRPKYVKWCGASAGPEPILLVFFKAQLPESPRWRACTGRFEGDNERVEKKNEMYTQGCLRSDLTLWAVDCRVRGKWNCVFVCQQTPRRRINLENNKRWIHRIMVWCQFRFKKNVSIVTVKVPFYAKSTLKAQRVRFKCIRC